MFQCQLLYSLIFFFHFLLFLFYFFFFNDTATTEIYTLSLHDALPIYYFSGVLLLKRAGGFGPKKTARVAARSEEHTSELQSLRHLVCRLLLEKKKIKKKKNTKQNITLVSKDTTR